MITTIALLSQMAQGQTEMEFDFEKKKFADPSKFDNLKRGDFYKLKITNINMNLYKISVDKSDSVIKSDLKTPDFGMFNIDALVKLAAGLSPFGGIAAAFDNEISRTLKSRNDYMQAIELPEDLVSTPANPIADQMNKEKEQIQDFSARLTTIKAEIDAINFDVAKYLLASKIELKSSANTTALGNGSFNFSNALLRIEKVRSDIKALQTEASRKKNDYDKFYEANKKKIDADKDYKENDGKIKDAYAAVIKSCEEALVSTNAEKANQLLSLIVLQDNNASFEYNSIPMQFNGDAGSLKITISPRSDDFKLQTYKTELKFPKPLLTYVGIGMSFYLSGLYDNAYSIKTLKIDSLTTHALVEENVTKNEIGTAFILRYGRKFDENTPVGVHVSFGPALSISNKVKARVVLGGGISFGKKHMIVIDGGFIGGYVDRLSKAYNNYATEFYSEKPEQTTVSVLKASGFASIGYMYRF